MRGLPPKRAKTWVPPKKPRRGLPPKKQERGLSPKKQERGLSGEVFTLDIASYRTHPVRTNHLWSPDFAARIIVTVGRVVNFAVRADLSLLHSTAAQPLLSVTESPAPFLKTATASAVGVFPIRRAFVPVGWRSA